jgi:sugar (pentulose or hexulose) kinase
MKILTIDFGTSSIKFSILDDTCKTLKTAKQPYQIKVYNGDWVELDGKTVINKMIEGIRGFGDYLQNLDVIAYDHFSPSMVFMDEAGDPLCPIFTHLDRRSKKQTRDILAKMGKERFQAITGIQPFTGGASITSVIWTKENQNDIFNKAARLGHLNTFIHKKLTGIWLTDPVNASQTGMYETISGNGWSKEICETFGIPMNLLPEIGNPGAIAGTLTKEMASLCNLKEGIPVALGTNDAAAAQIAAHNTKSGDILNVSGSSEMVSILTDAPRIDDQYYLRCAATPGLWQIYATTASGFVLDWFRKEFYRDMSETDFFRKEFPRVVETYLDKSSVKFLPYLAGDRQSLIPKKGAFTDLTLDTVREDFLASILLGIHEPIKNVITICESFLHLNKTIKLCGGMIDDAFLQVKEKLFPAYQFEIIADGPIRGSAMLAKEGLNKRIKGAKYV